MIGAILITYAFNPMKLLESVARTNQAVRWYIFFHGHDEALKAEIEDLAAFYNGEYFPYGEDRGVARSWNDGLLKSASSGDTMHLLLNDDMFFYDDGFDQFTEFVSEQQAVNPDFGFVSVLGFESDGPYKGEIRDQGLGCCAIGTAALTKVGYFDDNFVPAYFEDTDYKYRLKVAGMKNVVYDRVLIEHERSKTTRTSPELKEQLAEHYGQNHTYYKQKWGGDVDRELYTSPFGDERFDYSIGPDRIRSPYGHPYDRR